MANIETFRYAGSKNYAAFKPLFFNQLVKHDVFVDCFAGSGSVSKHILDYDSSAKIVMIEQNPSTFKKLTSIFSEFPNVLLIQGNFFDVFIESIEFKTFLNVHAKTLFDVILYFDPPYTFDSRRSARSYYGKYEWNDLDHNWFLGFIKRQKFKYKIMISHSEDDLYCSYFEKCNDWLIRQSQTIYLSDKIHGERWTWEIRKVTATTHVDTFTDCLFCNFSSFNEPLFCPLYVGSDFTDRQRIKRQLDNFQRKFKGLNLHQKQMLFEMYPELKLDWYHKES